VWRGELLKLQYQNDHVRSRRRAKPEPLVGTPATQSFGFGSGLMQIMTNSSNLRQRFSVWSRSTVDRVEQAGSLFYFATDSRKRDCAGAFRSGRSQRLTGLNRLAACSTLIVGQIVPDTELNEWSGARQTESLSDSALTYEIAF